MFARRLGSPGFMVGSRSRSRSRSWTYSLAAVRVDSMLAFLSIRHDITSQIKFLINFSRHQGRGKHIPDVWMHWTWSGVTQVAEPCSGCSGLGKAASPHFSFLHQSHSSSHLIIVHSSNTPIDADRSPSSRCHVRIIRLPPPSLAS